MRSRHLAVAAALILATVSAFAGPDRIVKTQTGYVRISDAPCTHERVLVLLADQFKAQFKQAFMVHRGRQLQICWIEDEGSAIVIDEEGDGGRIPLDSFTPTSGV